MHEEKTKEKNNNEFDNRKIAILALLDDAIKRKDNVEIDILLKKLASLDDDNNKIKIKSNF